MKKIPTPDEEEAEIYIRCFEMSDSSKDDINYWFRINPHETEENKFIPSYLPPVEGWGDFSCTAFGSTICTFGGSTINYCGRVIKGNCTVNFLDTSQSGGDFKWLRGIPMSHPRSKPYPVHLPDGRILVIGGREKPPFAEIFDPETQTWTPTDSTKYPSIDLGPRVFEIKCHRIIAKHKVLLHTSNEWQLVLYDFVRDSWQLYNNNLAKQLGYSVFLDDIMYVGCYPYKQRLKFLFAYDFENFDSDYKEKKLPGPLIPVNLLQNKADEFKHLEPKDWIPTLDIHGHMPHGRLLAVGNGKLAVIWGDFVKEDHVNDDGTLEYQMLIRLSVFKMIKRRTKSGALKSLDALPLYHKKYLAPGYVIMDCIAVFNSQKVKANEDLDLGSLLYQTEEEVEGSSEENVSKKLC